MKKIVILLTGLLLTQPIWAQETFYSGSVNVGENFGADWESANMQFQGTMENAPPVHSIKLRASNFNLTGEYGLFDFLGVGLIGRIDNYYVSEDEYIKTVPSAADEQAGAVVNIHFISQRHLDLLAGIDAGFSQLDYALNDYDIRTLISGYGTWGDIHATGRWYFGQVGINLSLYGATSNYDNLHSDKTPAGEYLVSSFKTMACGIGFGLQYRIL
ncbi:MAG TPA: hypothetical protein VK783_13480 [Bacteroidia bacterium]|nr:hypothetical protein [Bacteroidia bacterium]